MLSAFVIEPGEEERRTSYGDDELGTVRVQHSRAEAFHPELTLRGVTEAERRLQVVAREEGIVAKAPREGATAAEGEALCTLREEAQRAAHQRALAAHRRAHLDYEGVKQLRASRLSSEIEEARALTALDAAKADLEQARLRLERTEIAAPFTGVVDSVPAVVGALMRRGEPCAVLLDLDPIVIRTDVAESDVEDLAVGAQVRIRLLTGQEAYGQVAWVSRSANPGTRTFAVEVRVPNPDFGIRDGLSASLQVQRREQMAHRVSPSVLVFDDNGSLVVRTVDLRNIVVSYPVEILQDSPEGLHVGGLPQEALIMTLGQHYVRDGVEVEARQADAEAPLG